MARVRNNQGYRKKIAEVFIRPYIEQEKHARARSIFASEGKNKTFARCNMETC